MTLSSTEVVRSPDTNSFVVNGLAVTDPDAVAFLESLDESKRLEAVSTALHFGLLALRDFGTITKVDWIDKRFQSFETEIRDAFGKATQKLEDYLGEQGELERAFSDVDGPIRSVLDPYTEGSPFWDLRRDLEGHIQELRDVITREAGKEEEAAKGTQKGVKFEQELFDFLQPICSQMGDRIKRVGTKKVAGRQVGDLLIEVNETYLRRPLKIVMEAKSARTRIGGKDGLLSQLDLSMDTRKAQYGIGVVKPQRGLGGVHGCFAHIKPNKVLCTYEPDGIAVELAYRFGRTEALLHIMGESILDTATCASVSAKMAEIKTRLGGLSNAKTHLTYITSSASEIRNIVNTLQTDIGNTLIDIERLIRRASAPVPAKRTKKSDSKAEKS